MNCQILGRRWRTQIENWFQCLMRSPWESSPWGSDGVPAPGAVLETRPESCAVMERQLPAQCGAAPASPCAFSCVKLWLVLKLGGAVPAGAQGARRDMHASTANSRQPTGGRAREALPANIYQPDGGRAAAHCLPCARPQAAPAPQSPL